MNTLSDEGMITTLLVVSSSISVRIILVVMRVTVCGVVYVGYDFIIPPLNSSSTSWFRNSPAFEFTTVTIMVS
jgi:hypothetical protein